MIDPREISAMAGQVMGQTAPPQPMTAPAPNPEDLMAMLGQAPPQGMPAGGPPSGMPPGMPPGGPPGMPPGGPPPGGDQGPPQKPPLDLVPPGLKEEIAKYAASQQVQMSKQLLALAGPESSDVPAGRGLLLDLWNKRKEGVSDEQIGAWKDEGKAPAWILANSYPGRYALMSMGHWRPTDKVKFAARMAKLEAGDAASAPSSGQPYDPASLETVAKEDPTPALALD